MTTVVELADKFAAAIDTAITEYGAQTVELALTVYRLEAVKYLATSCAWLGIGVTAIKIGLPLAKKTRAENKKSLLDQDDTILVGGVIGSFVAILFGSIVAVGGGLNLLSPYEWLAAFGDPALMVMRNAMQSAGAL